jgi:hypothetical protein
VNKNAEVWVKALKSGKYIQATGSLSKIETTDPEDKTITVTSFCCLGVACDLFNRSLISKGYPSMWKENYSTEDDGSKRIPFLDYDGSVQESVLPKEVARWLGLASQSGTYFSGTIKNLIEGEGSLLDLNDGGIEFKEIADFISSEPEGLFEEIPELYNDEEYLKRLSEVSV